jgi:hypothetical protein
VADQQRQVRQYFDPPELERDERAEEAHGDEEKDGRSAQTPAGQEGPSTAAV